MTTRHPNHGSLAYPHEEGNPPDVLSIPDMAILGGLALIVFGPERLPGLARQAGRVVGDLRATSHAFVREMERSDAPTNAKPQEPERVEETKSSDSSEAR